MCLNKPQIKDTVAYLLFNCYFNVGLKIFCQTVGIPMGFDPVPFLPTFLLYFYESKLVNEIKNDPIKSRKLWKIFRSIDGLNSVNNGGKLEIAVIFIPRNLGLAKLKITLNY